MFSTRKGKITTMLLYSIVCMETFRKGINSYNFGVRLYQSFHYYEMKKPGRLTLTNLKIDLWTNMNT